MKKEQIREQVNKVRSALKRPAARVLLLAAGALLLYGALTFRVREVTLISGQTCRMEAGAGMTLKHNEDFSTISRGELTARKAGFDRFLALAPGHTDYFRLDVIDIYRPETVRFEGEIGDVLRIDEYGSTENTFESGDQSRVQADIGGTLRLRNAGTAQVLQTINGFQEIFYTVDVRRPELKVTPDVIYIGETAVASLDNFGGPDTDAVYGSSSDCVSLREGRLQESLRRWAKEAGLDPAGARITGKKAGSAVISARVNDTRVLTTLRVSELPYIKEDNTLMIGDRKGLDIANAIDTVSYESSDENVVAVEEGLLVPKGSGTCRVTARIRGQTLTKEFEIAQPEIVCSEETILKGSEVKFTLSDLAGEVTWSVSDPEILSLEEDGTARGLAPGTCQVTAHTGNGDFSIDAVVKRDFFGADRIPDDLPDGVKAMLSCVFYYEDCLQKDIGLGRKWQYSNHGWAKNYFKMFDVIDSGADGYRSCNCDSGPQWIIQDLEGTKSYKGIADFYSGGPSLKSLMNAGKVRPGDIFMGHRVDKETGQKIGHTFVYLGDNMTFDTGHGSGGWHSDGSIRHTDPRKAVFDTWIHPTDSSFTYTGYTLTKQVRLHDSYKPKKYRNAEGQLVSW